MGEESQDLADDSNMEFDRLMLGPGDVRPPCTQHREDIVSHKEGFNNDQKWEG